MEKTEIEKIMNVVDHTLLKPYAKEKEIKKLIDDAVALKTYSVCIHPLFAKAARRYITKKNYPLKIVVTADFPMGVLTTNTRAKILKSVAKDINEVDFVVQMGYVKSKKFNAVQKDVNKLVEIAHQNNIVIKFIVEDAYTTKEEKEKLYEIVCGSKADFIKTSTGFAEPEYASSMGNKIGADTENVRLMAETIKKLGSKIGIKAAGGIHSYQQVLDLLKNSEKQLDPKEFRLGMSGTKKLYEELEKLKSN
ncbi:deoxyribose-phosphate aldolase [Candidatus Parvarchaeota archaeon]|nr:deoxyribose-phosphate aldolase [Candidatus Parvarchaeota archaeon]